MKHSNNKEKFYFEIYKDEDDVSSSNDRFYFKLKDEDGNSYIRSRPYLLKTGCLKELKSVIRNFKNEFRFEVEQASNEKWSVILKAVNGERIATSPCFDTDKEAKNFFEILKNVSLKTPVIDKTK